MNFVLVALILTGPGVYEFQGMAEYHTMAECEQSLQRAHKNGTTKIVSMVCAKKDTI